MAKIKKTDRIVYALQQMGATEVESKSRKYRMFTRPDLAGSFYFVGKAGALRSGRTSSTSVSLDHALFISNLLSRYPMPKVGWDVRSKECRNNFHIDCKATDCICMCHSHRREV